MNLSLLSLEIWVVLLGLAVLLADLFMPPKNQRRLGYAAALGLFGILILSFQTVPAASTTACHEMFVLDGLALFFKQLFLVCAMFVLVISAEFSDQFDAGVSEFYSLVLFALSGMMLTASANNLAVLFVSLELITITFYVLVSFQRRKIASLEAGVKYLILGGLSSAFLVYGIALIYASAKTLSIPTLATFQIQTPGLLVLGLLLVLIGIGFKLAMVPMQIWAPDVYQGSPVPATAFLAVGSKAAGFVLLIRLFHVNLPEGGVNWRMIFLVLSAVTILYGNLGALPQRSLKRLLGYSSIANTGYMLMGFATMSHEGLNAILFFLGGYLFTLMAAFAVIAIIIQLTGSDDISSLAGLGQRSPFLAAMMTLAMASLAGVPPLVGFFGKFLLIKAAVVTANPGLYALAAIAIVGVIISFYYYFNVIRAIYWARQADDLSPVPVSLGNRLVLTLAAMAIIAFGLMPNSLIEISRFAVQFTQ